MSATHEQLPLPQQPVPELIKQYKLVIAAFFLAAASIMAAITVQHEFDAKPAVKDVNPTVGACGPPACPAHFAKNPITGICNVPC